MINKEDLKKIKVKGKKYVLENKKILKIIAVLFVAMMITAHIKGCIKEFEENRIEPRPIKTAKVTTQDVPVYLDSFGSIAAVNSTDVVAQITGEIVGVNFNEGDEVTEEDILFTIDDRSYQADLDKAKAQLEVDKVDLKFKQDTLERNRGLLEKELISVQDFEQYKTDVEAAGAQVKLDEASVEQANINLDYCKIKAPITGVTGKRQVDKGNIVTANSGPVLVNIKTISEVYVDFTVCDRDLERVREARTSGALKVTIHLDGDGEKEYDGFLESIDNTVNNSSGTIFLRAIVKNDDKALWPGQFVRVRLLLKIDKDALVVPYEAAQIGKQGYYVFTVPKDRKVDLKEVTVGEKDGDNIVIKEGLDKGQTVVTQGHLGLRPGTLVIDVKDIPKSMMPKT